MEVYQSRGLVEIPDPEPDEGDRNAERRRLAMNELFERVRDMYYNLEDARLERQAAGFIDRLRDAVEPILDEQQ